jgi:hypothetical protein
MNLKILVFILLFSNITFAQKKILIIDKENMKPIVNVAILINDSLKYASNVEGIFFIKNKDFKKKVIIKHVSYETINLNELINVDTIFFEKKINNLNEIILINKKNKELIILPPNSVLSEFGFYKGHNTNLDTQYVTYIPNEIDSEYKIKSIIIEMKKGHWRSENLNLMPFKLNLYSVDSILKIPLEKLIDESIYIKKENKNKIIVDVSDYNIDFKKEGIFVSVEILDIEEYVKDGFFYNSGPSFKYLKKLKQSNFFTLAKDENNSKWRELSFVYNFGIKIIK